jgi:hypothetical protein
VMYVSFIAELLSVDPVLMSGGPVLGVLPANRATAPPRRLARHLWTTARLWTGMPADVGRRCYPRNTWRYAAGEVPTTRLK